MIHKILSFLILSIFVCVSVLSYPSIVIATTDNTSHVETRGVWVTRWQYKTQKDIERIIDDIYKNNFNTVYFQVRGQGDAYYKSSYEPWADTLTGTLGKDPGFDPLQVAIDTAHERGLELHAWVNTMTLWRGEAQPIQTSPRQPYLVHPEWAITDANGTPMGLQSGYIFGNPLNPDFLNHLKNVFREIVTNYDVDGLHLDYIRYPGPTHGTDQANLDLYKGLENDFPSFNDFRREKLSLFVKEVKELVGEKTLSAAVIGYYQDVWGWGYDHAGAFDKYLQDSKRWVLHDYVDYITPMVYWSLGAKPEFETLVRDYATTLPRDKVVIGMSTTNFSAQETYQEAQVVRKYDLPGFALFSYASNDKLWNTYRDEIASW